MVANKNIFKESKCHWERQRKHAENVKKGVI